MIKKVLLATALVASASFATWDKFPVLEAGKGQAKVGAAYGMQGDISALGIGIGARYAIINGLEAGVAMPYTIFTDYDGNDGPDGLGNLTLMAKYQFMPIMNAFLDLELPIGEEDLTTDGLGFHFGVQYSQGFGQITLGSELGLLMRTAGDDKVNPPFTLNAGVEGDIAVNQMVTPYVGGNIYVWLGEPTYDGDEIPGSDASGTIGIEPYVGVGFAFNPMFTLDLCATFDIGEDMFGEDTAMEFAATLFVNF